MQEIKVGVVGIGQRGQSMLGHILDIENVKITAVCDSYTDRIQWGVDYILEKKVTVR